MGLAASSAAMAQPSMYQQASDIDWVSREQLSPAQQALIEDVCCGMYVEPALPPIEGDPEAANLSANTMDKLDEDTVVLEGDIEIRYQDIHLRADRGVYDNRSGNIDLEGNIQVRQPGMLLVGSDGEIENSGEVSRLNNASYVLHNESIRGSADVIVYTDADGVITIDNGHYTRCEPGDNSWAVEGSSIRLDKNSGRGLAKNVKLRVNDVPIMYLPVISFPINDERATGFLIPTIGSTRTGGLDVSTPYYLNLAPNYDATFTPRLMSDRGIMLGLEGRYRGRQSQNILQMNYLPDDDKYDPSSLLLSDPESPPTPDRWQIALDHRSRLSRQWSAMVDYAAVSDQDYFQDFSNAGLYTTTRSYLFRQGAVRYQSDNWRLRAQALSYQLLDPTIPESREPYKRLPRINLDGNFMTLNGLEYGVSAEYANFDRDLNEDRLTAAQLASGVLVTGQRLSLIPELSYTWSNPGAFFTPKAKYKYASYQLDDPSNVFTDNPSRGVMVGSLDSGLIFDRDLESSGLTQTLEPRLFYLYSEYEDQSDIPVFDSTNMTFSFNQLFREDRFSGKDRVGDANQLTLAVSTRFLNSRGQEKASASIGQIRYFKDRRVTLNNRIGDAQMTNDSAIASEMTYQFNDNWRVNSYVEWDSDENNLDVGNFQFRYQSDINHILNFSYRYRDVDNAINAAGIDRRIKQTDISGIWPLNDSWGLIGRWNYDHANKRSLETIAGVEYDNCCYSVRLLARRWIDNDALFFGNVDNNTGIFLQFELKGFGSVLGNSVSGILNNGISGYREREYIQ
jgi:LPS-assembly protein